MRISNSFSEGEIQVLEFIVQTLLRGGTPTMATRHKEFASLCRKVMAMKTKVHEQKARPERADHEESSVGTVEAPLTGVAHAEEQHGVTDVVAHDRQNDIARAV
jgi:hypothetical protein